jgi:hypothetical protein
VPVSDRACFAFEELTLTGGIDGDFQCLVNDAA